MRTQLLAALALAALSSGAVAADHPVGGDSLQLTQGTSTRKGNFKAARDPAIAPSTANDPRLSGATLEISGSAPGDGSTGTIALAAQLWTGLGNPQGSKGFRYKDRTGASGGVKSVTLKPGKSGGSLVVMASGPNWPYAITQPQGSIDVRLTVGDDTYCAQFTTFTRNQVGRVAARKAPPPLTCGGLATCGNGVAEDTEECDDGNSINGDGCSAACSLEDVSAICAGVATVSGTALGSVLVASGLASPTHVAAPPLDPNRLFVVEQPGRIRLVKNGTLLDTPFLAIEAKISSGGERGLLSVAFHPDYKTNGRFFVDYTNTTGDTVIARYQVSANPDVADATSEKILLTIAQPFANHNGGQAAFGPDGFMYVGMGDGGSGGDPLGNGQNDGTLLGKLLRLDVDVDAAPYYAVPSTNPNAAAGPPLGLIWAKGARNPWRFSFDRLNGDLYIADVGQNAWEEIDLQPGASAGGENYGWKVFEGNHCFAPPPPASSCPSPPTGFTMPILEYSHGQGCSITGGFVYRGCRMPDLHGTYFYADYCTAFIRTFKVVGGSVQSQMDRTTDLRPSGGAIDSITSFGEDARGELYVTDQGGQVYRVVPGS